MNKLILLFFILLLTTSVNAKSTRYFIGIGANKVNLQHDNVVITDGTTMRLKTPLTDTV